MNYLIIVINIKINGQMVGEQKLNFSIKGTFSSYSQIQLGAFKSHVHAHNQIAKPF